MMGVLAMIVYIGCYTDATHTNGLHAVELDAQTGDMRIVASYPVKQAIYQALSPNGRILYSCADGGLVSFEVEGSKLVKIGEVGVGGTPCHVSVMPNGRQVNWADYSGGRAGFVPVVNGTFGRVVTYQHKGQGPNLPRQDAAHCHQAVPTPDGKSFCVVDLGLDEVVTYPRGAVFGTLPKGAGPRHLLFHPNGELAFLIFELGNRLGTYRWSPEGGFAALDSVPTLPVADTGRGYNGDLAAAVRLSPDGRRVVISNRGENSLVAYDYETATGKLTPQARSLLPGSWPRDFLFVSETLALVTMERSDEVHALRYDAESGAFTVLSTLRGLFRPVAATKLP